MLREIEERKIINESFNFEVQVENIDLFKLQGQLENEIILLD